MIGPTPSPTMVETMTPLVMNELRLLPYFAIYFVAERLFGVRRLNLKAWLFDWQYWLVWVAGNSAIMAALQLAGVFDLQHHVPVPRLIVALGSVHPVINQLIILFTFDVFYYWFHRIQHTTALWPQHALHHAETHLSAATAFRHHLLENLVKVPLVDVPLMFIFVHTVWQHPTGWLTSFATGFLAYLGIFAHSNLRIGYGPLNWVLVSPQTHRIHHSIESRHWNRNFAAYFPLLDVVFGTYYDPRPGEYPDTGIPGLGTSLDSLPAALAYPFVTWRDMVRAQRRAKAEPVGPDAP